MSNIAFDEPIVVGISAEPIKTVEQAVRIVTAYLQTQFTMPRLNTLLVLERAAEGLEISEAREAFCLWAFNEGSPALSG